ncbi:MAG: isochorismatase family protein [Spirochaetota bacterium]
MTRLERTTTALLVIDIQERLLPVIDGAADVEARSSVAIAGARTLGVPVLATEQYPKGLGHTVAPIAGQLGDLAPVPKVRFSCCGVDAVDAELERLAPRTVLIAGIETHVCVMQTCLDLLERSITPVILADCVGSRHELDHRYALERLRAEGAVITTLEAALFELTGEAGTDEFKAISKLVKPL